MLKLNKSYVMSVEEIERFKSLPDIPKNKLNLQQKSFIWNLYYDYIANNIDSKYNGYDLCELPTFKKNWMSGQRTTLDQRKMLVLRSLVELNDARQTIKNSEIGDFLYGAIDCMEHYRIIIKYAYKKSGKWALNK